MKMEKLIPAFLEGEAKSVEKANKIAESYENCPYVAFMATTEKHVYIIYFLPEKQKWWVEFIEKKPQNTLGLEKAKLIFPQKIFFPKKTKMRLPKEKTEIAPCGSAECPTCPSYEKCLCCPATIHFKGK
jgi:hypothetical protein